MEKATGKYNFELLTTPRTTTADHSSSTGLLSMPDVSCSSMYRNYRCCYGSASHTTTSSPIAKSSSHAVKRKSSSDFCLSRSSTNTRTPGSRRSIRTRRTPYTTTTSAASVISDCSIIVSLVEGRGYARGEIGMVSLDLRNPELILSQFSDSQTYTNVITKLFILQPLEIVMPSTVCENGNSTKLFKLINENFPNTTISTVNRKYFNEARGLQYIQHLCLAEYSSVCSQVVQKYYCLATVAALLKYVEFIQNVVYAPASLKIVFKGSEDTTMIDSTTTTNLELVSNLLDPKSDHSLYGIFKKPKTAGGARLLRMNLLQPPCVQKTIEDRLECVQELKEKEEMYYNLQSIIERFLDIDHLVTYCVQIPKQETVKTAENKITCLIYMKHTLELVGPLHTSLGDSESALLKASYNSLDDPRFERMLRQIQTVVHDDTHYQKGILSMRTQKCFAIKPKINGLLDVARRAYTEIVDDIADMVKQLSEKYNLNLRTAYNNMRGFFIQMSTGSKTDMPPADQLPSIFIKVSKNKNVLSFTTNDLIKMNSRIQDSIREIYLMSNVVVTELLGEIREHISCFYKLSEVVSMLDMLMSLAYTSSLVNYVKPDFTDTLGIKQGRHPILEKIHFESPVPNDVYASEESTFVIITGPNMSGKSTYLKQIALSQIMAQIGSFVPAEYASVRICDQLFSRIGSDDDIETNTSTFMMEMKEMNYIIQNASQKSLIIIDELGRGTSAEEGMGLCYAICEYLIGIKAFTFFTTHFHELTKLEGLYPNVVNYNFEVHLMDDATRPGAMKFTHFLSKGVTQEQNYGLELAALSSMPSSVIRRAKEIMKTLQNKKKTTNETTEGSRVQHAVFRLATRLMQAARNSRLDEGSMRMFLSSLKNQYLQDVASIVPLQEE